jgi:hypothetical protein
MYFDPVLQRVVIRKGFMTFSELLDDLNSKDFTDTNLVLHLRIGTSGYTDGLNCHPYPIYDDNQLVCSTNLAMAHNGVLNDYHPGLNAKINDTQNFIQKVLKKLDPDFLQDDDKILLIKELIGTNKLCFLDSKNHITTIGDFIEDGGYIYSNTSYKPMPIYPHKYSHIEPISLFNSDYYQRLLDEDYDDMDPGYVDSFWANENVQILEFDNERTLVKFLEDLEQLDDDLYTDEEYFYEVDLKNLCITVEPY